MTKVAKYPPASHYKTQAFSSLGMLNNSDQEAIVNIKLYDYVIKHNGDMTWSLSLLHDIRIIPGYVLTSWFCISSVQPMSILKTG